MKKIISYVSVFVLFIFLCISVDAATERYELYKVVDGDTIKIRYNGTIESVRIIGINTPETNTNPDECFGSEATKKTKSLINEKFVDIEFDDTQGRRDKYDRLLAYVFVNGLDVGKELLSFGYAREYTYNKQYKYSNEYKIVESNAKTQALGLWSACLGYKPKVLGIENVQDGVYRFWSNKNKGHFYTISTLERDQVISNYSVNEWSYEGVAFFVSNCSDPASSKVYRFWSSQNKKHFYTNSLEERNQVINQYADNEWLYEGEAFCAYSNWGSEMRPVYRFWSEQNKSHFYTSSEAEKQLVIDNYSDREWLYEGVAYYVKK
jgi:endonuclease YncB( thermonuclease family)